MTDVGTLLASHAKFRTPSLVRLLEGYSSPDADIYVVYAQQHRSSVRVKALVHFVVDASAAETTIRKK